MIERESKYSQARNAPPLKLPENVAFAIGNEGDPVQYLVLQYVCLFVPERYNLLIFAQHRIHYAKKFAGNVRDYSGFSDSFSMHFCQLLTGITLHLSKQKPPNLAGVYLFISGDVIMPGYSAYYTNMSCFYTENTKLHPFA
jgi:hypothetical protein